MMSERIEEIELSDLDYSVEIAFLLAQEEEGKKHD